MYLRNDLPSLNDLPAVFVNSFQQRQLRKKSLEEAEKKDEALTKLLLSGFVFYARLNVSDWSIKFN